MFNFHRAQPTTAVCAAVVLGFFFCSQSSTLADPKLPRIAGSTNPYVNSTILKSGKYHTLIPKYAIVYMPERHKNRIGTDSSGSYLPWDKFLANNYGWLTTYEVTLDIAKGKETISEERLKRFRENGRIVVAVHKKHLMNIRPTSNKTD